ncbi:hypothetical protein BC939DRAFT_455957, partial [Gamsiella multidivaricata]|uniref:uncharacterized protein n=1 Tax=Gamsiella multidivaricata TaxID=101098 RepID=UPI002220F3FC
MNNPISTVVLRDQNSGGVVPSRPQIGTVLGVKPLPFLLMGLLSYLILQAPGRGYKNPYREHN